MEDIMQVSKWGNSLAVRLPKTLVEDMGLKEGDSVDVVPAGDQRIAIVRREGRTTFLDKLRALQEPAPEGFRWSREEANER
ncbi:MAG: AbrB/MazE/SpoVT family DNA-binding domain-containing protein [Hyphomicrobiales bacterium]